MKTMISETSNDSKVLWQTSEPDGIPEAAIILNGYSGTLRLDQEGRTININYESIDELIKELRSFKKWYQAQE